jgi:hypothetical protein
MKKEIQSPGRPPEEIITMIRKAMMMSNRTRPTSEKGETSG